MLLEMLDYPGRAELMKDLSVGFGVLGPLTPGTGWELLPSASPPAPLPLEDFRRQNRDVIREALATRRPSP